jgi:two-component system, OmpR family, alkaline phosphatase synthesis response regulator PhoP
MRVSKGKILIADDEPDILEILDYNLSNEGYEVIRAKNGDEAIELTKKLMPDVILLDIMMPGKSGLDVCNILRHQPQYKDIIIIFLTALNDETIELKGFDYGADDYITKPVSPKVLISKINAIFKRLEKDTAPVLTVGDLVIDREKYNAKYKGEEITLARKEFELLSLLAAKPGRVFLRNEILSKVWGDDVIVGDRTIDVHIRKIRQKLGVDCITTVKGVGYKFEL